MYPISFKLVPWFQRKSYKCSKVYEWRTKNADWKTDRNKTPYWLRWLKKEKNHLLLFFFYFIPVNIKSINTYFINGSQIFLKSCLHIYLTYQNSLYSDTGHWSAHILLLRFSAKVPQKLLLSFFFNFPTNYIEAQRSMFHLKEQMSFFL